MLQKNDDVVSDVEPDESRAEEHKGSPSQKTGNVENDDGFLINGLVDSPTVEGSITGLANSPDLMP